MKMMLPRSATLITAAILIATIAAAGCSRLTFVRQKFDRKDFERTAPEVHVSDKNRKKGGSADALARLGIAQQYLQGGDFESAQKHAQVALKLDPKSADAHTVLAAATEAGGNSANAGEHYRLAAELAPKRGSTLSNYGIWLCLNGHAAESLGWFDGALALPDYPTPAVALANAGHCAQQSGQGARAERDSRRALTLDAKNPVALATLAEREFRAGNAFEARAFSERRLAAAPADPRSLQLASQIEEKLGDKAAAQRYVQQLKAEFPNWRGSETGDGGTK